MLQLSISQTTYITMTYVLRSTKRIQALEESWHSKNSRTWNAAMKLVFFVLITSKQMQNKLQEVEFQAQVQLIPLLAREFLIHHWWSFTWTVVFCISFCSNVQKQLMMRMNQDQTKKKFRVWSKIDEVWWILVLVFLRNLRECGRFLDLILMNVHSVMIRMWLRIYMIP